MSDPGPAAPRWLFTPPLPAEGLALRREVLDRLSSPAVRAGLVIAPSGYGKTSYAATVAHEDARPVAWLDLEPQHDDVRVLLTALMAALSTVSDFDADDLGTGGGPDLYTIGLAAAFGRALRRCRQPFLVVLDDIHFLSDTSVSDVITALVSNVPAGSLVLLVGRACRLEALHRLRVDPGVAEVGLEDLALGPTEVKTVLVDLGLGSSSEQVGLVLDKTEGWPVGVRLAGLARVADSAARGHTAPLVTGRDAAVADYIGSEWMWGLSDEDLHFLRLVSVLDWLSGPLCSKVTGRSDAGEVLQRIHDNRMLVIPLDRRSDSYRMHRLLREALRADLERHDAGAVRDVHVLASEWFEAAADIDRAVRHALAGGDFDRAKRLIVEHTPTQYSTGQFATITRWVESMPRTWVTDSAQLCLCGAIGALGIADAGAVSAWLSLGEHAATGTLDASSVPHLCLRYLRSTVSTGPALPAVADAEAAYRGLPPGVWHAASCLAYGAWLWAADGDGAAEVLEEGAQEAALFGAHFVRAHSSAMLALIALSEGAQSRAWQLAERAHRVAAEHGVLEAPSMGIVNAVHALKTAACADPRASRADWQLARTQLAILTDISGWMNIQTRVALAHTSLLLGDRTGLETMISELGQFLVQQPDALRAQRQLAELKDLARHLRRGAAIGASSLTTAELRVLHYLPTNLTLAEIGARLFVSRYTVKTHCSSIYRKLDSSTRSEAVAAARGAGLLSGEDVLASP